LLFLARRLLSAFLLLAALTLLLLLLSALLLLRGFLTAFRRVAAALVLLLLPFAPPLMRLVLLRLNRFCLRRCGSGCRRRIRRGKLARLRSDGCDGFNFFRRRRGGFIGAFDNRLHRFGGMRRLFALCGSFAAFGALGPAAMRLSVPVEAFSPKRIIRSLRLLFVCFFCHDNRG
jgi:hypothetical protein